MTKVSQSVLDKIPPELRTIPVIGELDVAGFIAFDVQLALVLPDASNLRFDATGISWVVGALTAIVEGGIASIPPDGPCHYKLGAGAEGEGIVSLTLTHTSGQMIGMFVGVCEGIGFATVNGHGMLRRT